MDIRRGHIYMVDLGSPRGREPAYEHPVLVLSINAINRKPLVVAVVPGTSVKPDSKDHPLTEVRVPAKESGLPKDTIFKCFQITSVDQRKFPLVPAGELSSEYMTRIEDRILFLLGLPSRERPGRPRNDLERPGR